MSCNYSFAGQLLDCKENSGGVKEIYIMDYSYLSGFTVDANYIITGATLSPAKEFKTYQLRKQTGNITTAVQTNDANGTTFYQTDVIFNIPKMEAAKRLEFLALAVGNMSVIVRDNNNVYWAVGWNNPATLTAGSALSGVAYGDANQYTYTLQDLDKVAPYEIDGSLIQSIVDSNISKPLPV